MKRIQALVERRCARGKDGHLKNFAARSAKDVTKLFNIGDIKGALGRFGDDYKSAFDGNVMNTPAHPAWDSIYSNRQAVAHGAAPAQVRLAWTLQQGPHVLAIPGTSNPDHLTENVAAGALRLSPGEMDRL